MSRYDYPDPSTDPDRCDALSQQRCARCHVDTPVSDLVLVPGVGQICESCDDELLAEAMTRKSPELAASKR